MMNNKIIPLTFLISLIIISVLAAIMPINAEKSTEIVSNINSGDTAWMLMASAMVMLMIPGLSFFYGGMVQPKNIISTMLQSFVALGVITVIWYAVGFSLAFGKTYHGLIGNPFSYFFLSHVGTGANKDFAETIPFALFMVFQLKFAVITPALITGAFAERVRFWSYILFITLFCLFIYLPIAHWTWHPDGFLRRMGVIDFAGGTVVHITAGIAALAGAMVTGKRISSGEMVPKANITYVILGTGLLWFGWFGFNAGSALQANGLAVKAFINTTLASATGMLAWLLVDSARNNKPSAVGACVGAVVGLVAITPAAGFVDYGPALFIGTFSSIVSYTVVNWRHNTSIDDTLDVFPCHGVGGIVGMLLTAVFAEKDGVVTGHFHLLQMHVLGLLVVCSYVFVVSYALYKLTHWISPFRVPQEDETLGLDISQHMETLYEGR